MIKKKKNSLKHIFQLLVWQFKNYNNSHWKECGEEITLHTLYTLGPGSIKSNLEGYAII